MPEERPDDRLIGVYGDQQAAAEAAETARQAGAKDVRVGDTADEVAALRGEMREEAADVRPGFSTPEMKRTVPIGVAAAAAVGLVAALPLGFLDAGDLPLVTRVLLVCAIGAVIGATVGFIFGIIAGGDFIGDRRTPKRKLAAERGVVVGASESTGDVAPALGGQDPVRLDRTTSSGQPTDSLTTESRDDGGSDTAPAV